jgi:hypothetical protein
MVCVLKVSVGAPFPMLADLDVYKGGGVSAA